MNNTEYSQALAAIVRYVAKNPEAPVEQIRGAAEAHTRNRDKALELAADAIAARGSATQRRAEFSGSLAAGIVEAVAVAIGFSFKNEDGEDDQDCATRVMILPTDTEKAMDAATAYIEAIGTAKGETASFIEFEGPAETLEPIPA